MAAKVFMKVTFPSPFTIKSSTAFREARSSYIANVWNIMSTITGAISDVISEFWRISGISWRKIRSLIKVELVETEPEMERRDSNGEAISFHGD
jgi:hypothetical protein